MIYTNNEQIEVRLKQLQNYLDQKWNSLSDNFVERLLARAEYDRLLTQLKNNVIQNIK